MAHRKSCSLSMLSVLIFYVVIGSSASDYGYGYGYNSNLNSITPKNIKKEMFFPEVFGVQGVVYCKSSSSKVLPLKGSVVRITCLGIDKYGYETAPFSIISRSTDSNGYFLVKLSSQLLKHIGGLKITQCKAFLHSSPRLETCPFATDFNMGSGGAPLLAYRTLGSDNVRLYSVGPFMYGSTPPQIISSNY